MTALASHDPNASEFGFDNSISRRSGEASTTVPERRAADWGVAVLLFAASCLYLRPFYNFVNFTFDEGVALQGARRILQGQVLYRDFFSFYTPGSYYWTAFLFKVFGTSILVGRIALLVYGGIFSVLTYFIARRVCSRATAIFATIPTLAVCLPGWFLVMHSWDSTLSALLTLYCAVWFLETRQWAWGFGLGSLAAITCLVEQSKGAGLVLGLAVGLIIIEGSKQKAEDSKAANGYWRLPTAYWFVGLGLAWPVLLTVAYFGAHRALYQMATDILWPLYHYSTPSKLPYGYVQDFWMDLLGGPPAWRAFILLVVSPFFIISALPIFAVCGLGYWTFEFRRGRTFDSVCRYYVLVSAVLAGLLVASLATGRPDAAHIMVQGPLFCIVLGWMAEAPRTPFLRAVKTLAISYILLSFAGLGFSFLEIPLSARYELQISGGTLRTTAPLEALAYIQRRVLPGERILVYPYQPLYYFLTGTYSVSRYERLLVGTYEPMRFQEMARELVASRPRVVLFDPSFTEFVPRICPNVSLQALAARDPVVDTIFSRYHACRAFGDPSMPWHVVYMARNDLFCDSVPGEPAHSQ